MPILKAPAHPSAVSVGHTQFAVDEHGLINTGSAPDDVVRELMANAGCRHATDEEIDAAATAEASGDAQQAVKAELADVHHVRAQLDAMGIGYDRRLGAKTLKVTLDRALKDKAAAEQATADKLAAQKAAAEKAAEEHAAEKAVVEKAQAEKVAGEQKVSPPQGVPETAEGAPAASPGA